jgi:hypothetical protein
MHISMIRGLWSTQRSIPHAMEAAMKRGRAATMAIPLLIGIALLLSACVGSRDYDTPVYSFGMPYGSLNLDGWR